MDIGIPAGLCNGSESRGTHRSHEFVLPSGRDTLDVSRNGREIINKLFNKSFVSLDDASAN
jgi:hypothetical protein